MKRILFAALLAAIPALQIHAQSAQAPAPVPQKPTASHPAAVPAFGSAEQTAMVKQYCTGCHSDRSKAGQLTLASFDAANAATAENLVTTEKMIRKLRAG